MGGGNLAGLGPPGWSHRYHDTYFKTHIHNTCKFPNRLFFKKTKTDGFCAAVPPPGFSLLHQSGSGLKPSLSSGIETMDWSTQKRLGSYMAFTNLTLSSKYKLIRNHFHVLYTQTVSTPVPTVSSGSFPGNGNLQATTHTSLSISSSNLFTNSCI